MSPRRQASLCVALLALALASACDARAPDGPKPERARSSGAQPLAATQLAGTRGWAPCSWAPGGKDRLAECAVVLAPLDYARPAGPQIRLRVKRRQARVGPTAQVWILHGGPGASATEGMKDLSFGVPELRPDIEYYAVDHRGVGGSERLGCPAQEARKSPMGGLITLEEWPACIAVVSAAAGPRLADFTTTNAARDLGRLVEAHRRPGTPVFIYGASYGAYLARRYLQLFPGQPAGVILEGAPAARDPMTGYDQRLDETVLRLLAACDRAPECRRHFDAPTAATTERVLKSLDQGHCSLLNLRTAMAKTLLASMAFSASTRVLIPPLVHRIERCRLGDIWVVARTMLNYISATQGEGYSPVLHNHIALSEMYRPAESAPALQARFDAAPLSTGLELTYARLFPLWPRYPRDALVGREPAYDGPMLILQGGLDPAAALPLARTVQAEFRSPRQHWVLFPQGAHGVTGKTPAVDGRDCGRTIFLQFVDRPQTPPDTGCIARVPPLDWKTIPAEARRLTGTSDLWGDGG